mmetsp:Transcript_2477/g.5249  ORF Transcript_2477/g.5249 Transcript_2477/m.5249 type:complete len:486 (-) Transcript_2477:132-1589(-)
MLRPTRVLRATLSSINAFTGAPVGIAVQCDDGSSVESKFLAAVKAQPAWAATSFEHRAACLKKFQGLLVTHTDELANLLSEEMGKPVAHAKGEIHNTIPRIQFFLDNVEAFTAEECAAPASAGTEERVRYEPIGVVGNISAWNFPYFVGSNVWAPALLTGNAVLYKPSEWALQTGRRVSELMAQSGVPSEVFCPVYGSGVEVGAALARQPLDGLFFTGSEATGRKLAAAVYSEAAIASRDKRPSRVMFPRLQLELGGKDPAYVRADVANAFEVGQGLADGAMFNNGQSCCGVERVYAHADVHEQVVAGAVAAAKSFVCGDPKSAETYLGPLCLPSQAAFLQSQVADAVGKGAAVVCGGSRTGGIVPSERFYPPTVLTGVDHSMSIMTEESFGPVLGIMKVHDDEEAVALMNDTKFGLTASVWTKSQSEAEAILKKVNTGTGYWNCCDRVSPYSPWSGRGASGIGSTLGQVGIAAFVQPKAYHLRA